MVRPSQLKNPLQVLPALRLVLLAMAAFVALALPASASAYKGVEVEAEAYPVPFTASSTEQAVLRISTGSTMACESSSATGEWTSGSSGTAVLEFINCVFSLGQEPCTVVSNTLSIKPIFLDAARTKVGILFSPPASGKFAQSACLGWWGSWTGSLIGEVVDVDKEITEGWLRFEAKGQGIQKYRQVEEAGPILQLAWPSSPKMLSIENVPTVTYQSPVVYRRY